MRRTTQKPRSRKDRSKETGSALIEMLVAGAILMIGSMGMVGLLVGAIATNNRNRMDSSQTMLAESILEQIHSTFNGTGVSALQDCSGTNWTVDTTIPNVGSVGAQLNGGVIDFSEATPPAGYHMNYVVNKPCSSTGAIDGTYDVRWHLDQIGTTNTYLITVSARLKDHGEGDRVFAFPVTLRFMTGS